MRLFSRPFFIVFFTLQIAITFGLFGYTLWLVKRPVKLVPGEGVLLRAAIQLESHATPRHSLSKKPSFLGLNHTRLVSNSTRHSMLSLSDEDEGNTTGFKEEDTQLIDYVDDKSIDLEDETDHLLPESSEQDVVNESSSSSAHRHSHLLGTLYAVIGGVFSSHGMILAKSGYVLKFFWI